MTNAVQKRRRRGIELEADIGSAQFSTQQGPQARGLDARVERDIVAIKYEEAEEEQDTLVTYDACGAEPHDHTNDTEAHQHRMQIAELSVIDAIELAEKWVVNYQAGLFATYIACIALAQVLICTANTAQESSNAACLPGEFMDSVLRYEAMLKGVAELDVKDIKKTACPLCFKRFWGKLVPVHRIETNAGDRRIMMMAAQFKRYPYRVAWTGLEDNGSPLSDRKLLQELFANPEGFEGLPVGPL